VDMKPVDSTGLMSIERVGLEYAETDYHIKIPGGNNLVFATSEQFTLDNDFRNFVLALNLTQGRICMNEKKGDFPRYEVTPKVPESKTTVTKSDGGVHFHAEEFVAVRDEVHITIGIRGEIDENKVVDIFQRLQKLKKV
jgi:hypothetical protein